MIKPLLVALLLSAFGCAAPEFPLEGVDCRQGCEPVELSAPGELDVHARADAPVRFSLYANLCARLTGPALFHDASGYGLESCQVFDNRNPYGTVYDFTAEPSSSAVLRVETGVAEFGSFCQLSCATVAR